jgi:precorrin-6B methylase 1
MIMGQGKPKWLKHTIANPRGDATDGDARVALGIPGVASLNFNMNDLRRELMKIKRVKAWVILIRGDICFSGNRIFQRRTLAVDMASLLGGKVVPCIITYSVTASRRGKK